MMINNVLDIKNVEYRRRKYFADSEYFFKFIDIPNGSYKMGLDDAPDNREKPAVNVQISDFKISPYLVTNKLFYEDFPFSENRTDLYSGANSQPVNNVTWYDAIVFAWWLGCDLPTEAEWEYACRAGGADDTILFNPNEIPNYAWYGENSENVTHVVGGLKPNSWGLYDMLGNVREWVKDWYSENIYEEYNAIGTIIDPIGPSNGELKVLRGGVFDWALTHLRPTYRPMNPPQNRFFGNGIRLVTRPHRGNLYDGSTFLHDDYTKAETDK
jgi:formylglycine-generating enzyme required for sulfatase activity